MSHETPFATHTVNNTVIWSTYMCSYTRSLSSRKLLFLFSFMACEGFIKKSGIRIKEIPKFSFKEEKLSLVLFCINLSKDIILLSLRNCCTLRTHISKLLKGKTSSRCTRSFVRWPFVHSYSKEREKVKTQKNILRIYFKLQNVKCRNFSKIDCSSESFSMSVYIHAYMPIYTDLALIEKSQFVNHM